MKFEIIFWDVRFSHAFLLLNLRFCFVSSGNEGDWVLVVPDVQPWGYGVIYRGIPGVSSAGEKNKKNALFSRTVFLKDLSSNCYRLR